MIGVSLWKKDQVETGISMICIGEFTVLEHDSKGNTIPHVFESEALAVEFIIKQAYGLLCLGYEVYA